MHKYGREFSAAVMENRDGCVSERVRSRKSYHLWQPNRTTTFQVMKKLANDMPSSNLVDGYLTEIARGYGVRWTSDSKQVGDDDDQPRDAQDFVVSHSLTLSTGFRSFLLGHDIAV